MTVATARKTAPPPDDRRRARAAFLAGAGWGDAAALPLAGDASTRAYDRLTRLGGERALLMDAPPAAEGASCPADADPATRAALGYNALARLAGPNLNAFVDLAATLRSAGLSAPEVYAHDADNGFALIEDLGDDLYARAIPAGADERTLYEVAIDALLALADASPAPPARAAYSTLDYDDVALQAEAALLQEWYAPFKTGRALDPAFANDVSAAWAEALAALAPPRTLVLRDFHAENLIWLPDRVGAKRVGVIDFQDGLVGDRAYDPVSLLEDARRDVAPELAEAMLKRYVDGAGEAGAFDEDGFRAAYALLGAQRNAKILGVFARLIVRDGKPRYADFLPRVEANFRRNMRHPALARVRAALAGALPELTR
ncbi:MAG: aminoglycoside phosphotransferase family protein [Parvularculaceae bacterium]